MQHGREATSSGQRSRFEDSHCQPRTTRWPSILARAGGWSRFTHASDARFIAGASPMFASTTSAERMWRVSELAFAGIALLPRST
jgi:hypothetical protein